MKGKRTSHANRGKGWEALLEVYHARYEAQGRAVVIRTPPPMRILHGNKNGTFTAVYTADGPPDYVLLAGGRAVMAEAKQCHQERWSLGNLHAHQGKRLDQWEAQGGSGCVLLQHVASGTSWVLPWSQLGPVWRSWRAYKESGKRAPAGTASLGRAQLLEIGQGFSRDGYLEAVLRSC